MGPSTHNKSQNYNPAAYISSEENAQDYERQMLARHMNDLQSQQLRMMAQKPLSPNQQDQRSEMSHDNVNYVQKQIRKKEY